MNFIRALVRVTAFSIDRIVISLDKRSGSNNDGPLLLAMSTYQLRRNDLTTRRSSMDMFREILRASWKAGYTPASLIVNDD
jgi:hypothetical protein